MAGGCGLSSERDPCDHHREQYEQRRKRPPRLADPQVRQLQAAGRLPLTEDQIGDETTALYEYYANAKQTAPRPAQLWVVGERR